MSNFQKNSIFLLRVLLAGLFLYAGIDKILSDFSATGYLMNATKGPFATVFQGMNSELVDYLVMYGEALIGLALLLGIFVRFSSVVGILMMSLFYLSILPQPTGPISNHIIYIACFVILISSGSGRYLGLDRYIERNKFVAQNFNFFRFILG